MIIYDDLVGEGTVDIKATTDWWDATKDLLMQSEENVICFVELNNTTPIFDNEN